MKDKIPILYVVYASATGNAEVIAKRIHQESMKRNYESQLFTLNAFKKVIEKRDLSNISKESHDMTVVCVCSTTGNGDVPENGDLFYRFLKRSKNNHLLAGVRYGILGLGDTNYDKFNNASKLIDKRMLELGAVSFCERGEADDATGLEEVVEAWISQLWNHLERLYSPFRTETLEQTKKNVPKENGNKDREVSDANSSSSLDPLSCFIKIEEQSEAENIVSLNVLETCSIQRQTPGQNNYSIENPFLAPITGAKYLTSSTADKQVLHLELGIVNSGIQYSPGDAIGILCQNDESDVQKLLNRLKIDRSFNFKIQCADEKLLSCMPSHLPLNTCINIEDLLRNKVDITATATLPLIRMLAQYCSDINERAELLKLSTPILDQNIFRVQIHQQRANILDLLSWYPSCNPPLGHLLQLLPAIQPRYYSISCSQLKYSDQIHIAFTIVDYTTPPPYRLQRYGVCTRWLKGLATKFLREENVAVPIYIKPTPEFTLPKDLHAPLIMIGPGTGVAPFRAFLQHREALMVNEKVTKQEKDTNWLFFGCRRRDRDFLYRNELRHFEQSVLLLNLMVATSQEASPGGLWYGGTYVQDLLREYSEILINIMRNKNGYLYVCGDANGMAKDVHKVLRSLVEDDLDISKESAEILLESWEKEGRYQRDVWS